MSVPSLPFVFSANTLIQSAQFNANFSTLVSALTANLDSTNFSIARGLGANFITALGTGNSGAFQGGAYVFTPNTNAVVPLAVVGLAGQSVDLFDVSTSVAKAVWVDSAGALHTLLPPVGPSGGTFLDTSATGQVKTGTLGTGALTVTGTATATTFSGSGASLTNIPNAATTATNGNTPFTIVTRDGSGGFSAGTITAALSGNATTATSATTANTLTTPRAINGVNFDGSSAITIKATATNALTAGAHLSGGPYDGSAPITIATDATNANTASAIVARDAAGAFSMGALTAASVAGIGGTVQSLGGQWSFIPVDAAHPVTFANAANSAVNMSIADTGLVTFRAGIAGATTASLTGQLDFNMPGGGRAVLIAGGGTNNQYFGFSNTGNTTLFGVESSAGGTVAVGASAYATILNTNSARSLQFATNNTVRQTIDSSGATTFTGTLASGAVTSTGLITGVGLTAGTGTVQGSSNGSTVAFHPPLYTVAGAATAGTAHYLFGSITGDGATTAFVVNLSGAAVFASATSYAVSPDPPAPAGITYTSGSSFTITYSVAPGNGVVRRFLVGGT